MKLCCFMHIGRMNGRRAEGTSHDTESSECMKKLKQSPRPNGFNVMRSIYIDFLRSIIHSRATKTKHTHCLSQLRVSHAIPYYGVARPHSGRFVNWLVVDVLGSECLYMTHKTKHRLAIDLINVNI